MLPINTEIKQISTEEHFCRSTELVEVNIVQKITCCMFQIELQLSASRI